MARNRQRAKDRKLRRDDASGDRRRDEAAGELQRENVPGELQHASGEVDEVEASIIAGAGGEQAALDDAALEAEEEREAAEALTGPQRAAVPSGPKPEGNRVLNFLRASWSELQRVQWPDRRQVTQATAVVIGFVALAGAYLGIADWAAQRVVNFII